MMVLLPITGTPTAVPEDFLVPGEPTGWKKDMPAADIKAMGLAMANDPEVLACLRSLKATHAGTGFMHESFDQDDPKRFTRKWFAWANTLFGELILRVRAERPHLLQAAL